jgi:hypothetical protein
MPRVKIDDLEFETLLEKIIDLWAKGKDTMQMAAILEITEAKADYALSCLIEGIYMGKEDEAESTSKETGIVT